MHGSVNPGFLKLFGETKARDQGCGVDVCQLHVTGYGQQGGERCQCTVLGGDCAVITG
jgi:hypothetical protein